MPDNLNRMTERVEDIPALLAQGKQIQVPGKV